MYTYIHTCIVLTAEVKLDLNNFLFLFLVVLVFKNLNSGQVNNFVVHMTSEFFLVLNTLRYIISYVDTSGLRPLTL